MALQTYREIPPIVLNECYYAQGLRQTRKTEARALCLYLSMDVSGEVRKSSQRLSSPSDEIYPLGHEYYDSV